MYKKFSIIGYPQKHTQIIELYLSHSKVGGMDPQLLNSCYKWYIWAGGQNSFMLGDECMMQKMYVIKSSTTHKTRYSQKCHSHN